MIDRLLALCEEMLRFVNDYTLNVHLAYKDDDLFRNGSVHEW